MYASRYDVAYGHTADNYVLPVIMQDRNRFRVSSWESYRASSGKYNIQSFG